MTPPHEERWWAVGRLFCRLFHTSYGVETEVFTRGAVVVKRIVSAHCAECGRPLTNKQVVARGYVAYLTPREFALHDEARRAAREGG